MPLFINSLCVIFALLIIASIIPAWASDRDPKPRETSQTSKEPKQDTSSIDAYHKDNPMSHIMN